MNRRSFTKLLPVLPAGVAAAVQTLAQRATTPIPLTREFLLRHMQRWSGRTEWVAPLDWTPEWIIRVPPGMYRLAAPFNDLGLPQRTVLTGMQHRARVLHGASQSLWGHKDVQMLVTQFHFVVDRTYPGWSRLKEMVGRI